MDYITYEEYVELGGTESSEAFPNLIRKAQRWLDYFTFNRIPIAWELDTSCQQVVKEVLVEFVSHLSIFNQQGNDSKFIASYSNGIEDIKYTAQTEEGVRNELKSLALDWLPDYLTNRGVNFDVTKYLQAANNHTE